MRIVAPTKNEMASVFAQLVQQSGKLYRDLYHYENAWFVTNRRQKIAATHDALYENYWNIRHCIRMLTDENYVGQTDEVVGPTGKVQKP